MPWVGGGYRVAGNWVARRWVTGWLGGWVVKVWHVNRCCLVLIHSIYAFPFSRPSVFTIHSRPFTLLHAPSRFTFDVSRFSPFTIDHSRSFTLFISREPWKFFVPGASGLPVQWRLRLPVLLAPARQYKDHGGLLQKKARLRRSHN